MSKKYEYITRYYGSHDLPEHAIQKYLNDMGNDGWELIQIIERSFINESGIANRTFIFKKIKT